MIHVIVRTCERDDYIGRLAMESLKDLYGRSAIYWYSGEHGEYNHCIDSPMLIRDFCDNFGGRSGVHGFVNMLKSYAVPVNRLDTVMIVDSDIIAFDKAYPMPSIDLCGVGGSYNGFVHISGQFQIISFNLFDVLRTITDNQIDQIIGAMLLSDTNIADDTFVSYLAMSNQMSVYRLEAVMWVHQKYYEYSDRTDYMKVVNEIRGRHGR
jgi:hypothetical protein